MPAAPVVPMTLANWNSYRQVGDNYFTKKLMKQMKYFERYVFKFDFPEKGGPVLMKKERRHEPKRSRSAASS